MNNSKNKKGVFYLFVAIILLALVLILSFTYESYNYRDKEQSVEYRIRLMNDFINDFHNDVHRSTKISATRSLIAMEDYVSTNGNFFQNKTEMNTVFREVFYYGTIYGNKVDVMNDSSFQDYSNKVNSYASNIGMIFIINVTSIDLSQSDSWNVQVNITSNIKLYDINNLSYWDYNSSFMTNVPIDGLRDPLYSLNTLGRVQNVVLKDTATFFVNSSNNNTLNLLIHLNNSFYTSSANAPSFLMRYYNDSSSSPQGIESMVNVQLFSDQGIDVDSSKSVVDYEYFYDSNPANICNIHNMPSWFKVRSKDLNTYQINLLNYTSC